MLLPDPAAIDALARTLDDRAALVRDQCRLFERRVSDVRWQSAGADHYRGRCAAVARDLRRNAEELGEAADALRRHADEVRETIAWMQAMVASLEQQAREAWEAAGDGVEGAFEWGRDQAEGAWNKVKSWL